MGGNSAARAAGPVSGLPGATADAATGDGPSIGIAA